MATRARHTVGEGPPARSRVVGRYLVVAHKTATSPELQRQIQRIISRDPSAEFTVLVPATPLQDRFTWDDQETLAAARQRLQEATALLADTGGRVSCAAVGGRFPLGAIEDELREHPGYDEIVICTLPPGVSEWLQMDLPSRARRKFGLPVHHVIAHPAGAAEPPARVERHLGVLISMLESKDPDERHRARRHLDEIGAQAAAKVMEVTSHPDAAVRWAAYRTLVDLRAPESIPVLLDGLEDEDVEVRWLAAHGLAEVGDAALVPLLRRLIASEGRVSVVQGAQHVCRALLNRHEEILRPLTAELDRGPENVGVLLAADAVLRRLEGAPQLGA